MIENLGVLLVSVSKNKMSNPYQVFQFSTPSKIVIQMTIDQSDEVTIESNGQLRLVD